MLPLDPARVVRGQYEGYRDIPEVADDSDVDTLVAVEARIENERWDGVPFYLRTGKRMPEMRRTITLTLKHAPLHLFPEDVGARNDQLVFEIGEPGSIRIHFMSKEPGPTMILGPAHFDFEYRKSFHARQELEAYERLLHDAMLGERMLFNRAEGVERLWEVSAPLLASPPPVQPVRPGHLGPRRPSTRSSPRTPGTCPDCTRMRSGRRSSSRGYSSIVMACSGQASAPLRAAPRARAARPSPGSRCSRGRRARRPPARRDQQRAWPVHFSTSTWTRISSVSCDLVRRAAARA